MDIRIIKNATESSYSFVKNGYLIQAQISESGYGDIGAVKYFMYDPKRNESTEIEPAISKYNLIDIRDIKYNSDYVYFCGIEKASEGDKHNIIIYRYSITTKECAVAYQFAEKLDKYQDYMQTTIYAVNEYYLIIQHAFLRANLTEEYADYFDFEQYMYSVNEEKTYKITDERFSRYGIMMFKPISNNICVIKLGYDLLKDNRYQILKKNEAAIESVSLVNIGQMVSDILIGQQEIVLNTIDTVYYTATIPYVKLDDEYIIYSKVKLDDSNDEEIVFYNYATKETIMCVNNISDESLMPVFTCIMDGTLYVMRKSDKGYEFIPVKGNKSSFYINQTDTVRGINGNIVIVSGQDKGLLGKTKPYVAVYKSPSVKLLHKEKGNFVTSFMIDNDHLYLVIKP